MSDKLVLIDGDGLEIGSVIDALEAEASKAEVLEALRALRTDKIKHALSATVDAATFDRDAVFADFLADNLKSANTKATYVRECSKLFAWLDRQNVHTLQVNRLLVNRFRDHLLSKYSANTVRVTLASCSAFYSFLEAVNVIGSSPFAKIKYPRRQFKKAIRTDSSKPEPVPTPDEIDVIEEHLKREAERTSHHVSDKNASESAKRLLLALHFLTRYGLRISSLLTLEVHDSYLAYGVKGSSVRQKDLLPETASLECDRRPFANCSKSGLQNALRKVTGILADRGEIRHRFSAHDFRHYFAVQTYEATRDVFAVMRSLDHSSVSVTTTYLASLGLST